MFIYSWSRGFRKLFIWRFYFDNFICNRQIARREIENENYSFSRESLIVSLFQKHQLFLLAKSLMVKTECKRNGHKAEIWPWKLQVVKR